MAEPSRHSASDEAAEKGRESYEEEHVHQVYEQIASHFSATRYKPWPLVEKFLLGLPNGSIGLDVGCGNGKYLGVNRAIYIVGSDRSQALVRIAAQQEPQSAVVADSLALPHKDASFDFAISIAVVHHLSSQTRRVAAVREILRTLRPLHEHPSKGTSLPKAGKALVYVWALEQRGSRRGWDESDDQDVMVPWVMKGKSENTANKSSNSPSNRAHIASGPKDSNAPDESTTRTYKRYYHLYRSGELEHDIVEAGGVILDSGYEKDNWWAIAHRPALELQLRNP